MRMGALVLGFLIGFIAGVFCLPLLACVLWAWGTRNPPLEQACAPTPLPGNATDADHIDDWGAGLGDDLLRELKTKHVPDVASGYFAVCRDYVSGGVIGKPPERATSPATSAVTAMESPSVYQSMYRSIFDRNRAAGPTLTPSHGKSKKIRNVFYVVLRLGHLMLYDDAEQVEVRHVISLAHYSVSVYAGGEAIPEGELWIKRNCIRLEPGDIASAAGAAKPFYLFSDNCSEKEDFYHAMLRSQESHGHGPTLSPPPPLKFNPTDLIKLVQQLHASEENLHTLWINALIGRVFLAMYKTKHIEDYIWTKVTKKIDRVQKPSLIRSIKVQRLDMGDSPPFITNPKLKELTVDGALTVEADISYKGNFRIDISAVARIDLGPHFKPREVNFILATILKSLEGHVLIRIKPPPSNRIWISFETPPKMELSLEPIVSSRQITYGVIIRAIESRIREVVNETLVLPNWDDVPFTSTCSHQYRGGIWDEGNDSMYESRVSSIETVQAPQDPPIDLVPRSSAAYSSSNDAILTQDTLQNRKSAQLETYHGSLGVDSTGQLSPTVTGKVATGSPPSSPSSSLNMDRALSSPDWDKHRNPPTQSFDDILAAMPMDTTSTTKTTSLADEFTSLQRRPTLNKSLNSATNAAKKWLARQNTSSSEVDGSEATDSARLQSVPKHGHQMGPIGRGQPLPPPGTPLPHPPNRRGTWSAQTASALANLARRAPSGAKAVSVDTPTDMGETDSRESTRPNASTTSQPALPDTPPPPLPKRRQRTPILEQDHFEEEIFVVKAPSQETSAPSSPSRDDDT